MAAPAATAASTKSCTRLCGSGEGFALNENLLAGRRQLNSRLKTAHAIDSSIGQILHQELKLEDAMIGQAVRVSECSGQRKIDLVQPILW